MKSFELLHLRRSLKYGDIQKVADHFQVSTKTVQRALRGECESDVSHEIIKYVNNIIRTREKRREELIALLAERKAARNKEPGSVSENTMTNSKNSMAKNFAEISEIYINGFRKRYLKRYPTESEAKLSHPTNMSDVYTFDDGSFLLITPDDVYIG